MYVFSLALVLPSIINESLISIFELRSRIAEVRSKLPMQLLIRTTRSLKRRAMTLVIELDNVLKASLRSIDELTTVGVACRTRGA